MKHYLDNNCSVELLPFKKTTRDLIKDSEEAEDAFYLCDIGDVITKYNTWMDLLPSIQPFYAVKCNDDPVILNILAKCGTSFDCASKVEIEKALRLGVSPSRIIYAHPCKQPSFIRFAKKHQVNLMTFDNEDELYKIKNIFPDARLVLRVQPPRGFKVQLDLGVKFGCPPKRVLRLLQVAKNLDLNVMGISFHVGNGCDDPKAYEAAISMTRAVCDQAQQTGFKIALLDIGGGFRGHKAALKPFTKIAEAINDALDKYFPASTGIKVIAEPGTYFVASAFTLVTNVIAKSVQERDEDETYPDRTDEEDDSEAFMYYVNDGVYGTLNCVLTNPSEKLTMKHLQDGGELVYRSCVWGPTCDGQDLIINGTYLPELSIGDWLFFENMGAYTLSIASTFNGLPLPKCHYYCLKDTWNDAFLSASEYLRG